MANTPSIVPDPYRDNEAKVINFADHIRETAINEKKTVIQAAEKEIDRFQGVMFWVNTQYGGTQLRLRDGNGKVITKLKPGTQLKIMGDFAQSMDDDRNKGNPDEHIWVQVEVDAADTEAGGTGKIKWWVSTEYIKSLSEPVKTEIIEQPILDPILDNPESWGEEVPDVPEPPAPNPDTIKPVEETEKPNTVQTPDKKYVEVPTPPVVPVAPEKSESETREKPNTVQAPDKQYQPVPVPTNTPNTQPANETEKPNSVQIGTEKPVAEKKKWLFGRFIDANVALYNWVTGDKGIVSKESTTTTKSGELEVKPTENTNTEIKKEEKGSINIAE